MEEVIEHFKGLSDEDSRISALERIVQSLTLNELRAVSAMLSGRHDITSRLPFELIQQVFSYLPLYSAWNLQLVCREWRSTLSSDRFLSARVAQEESLARQDRTQDAIPKGALNVKRTVRRIHALRLGRPFSYTRLEIDGGESFALRTLQKTALRDHHVAYVRNMTGVGSEVVVQELRFGGKVAFTGEARENILCLTLAETLVAFVSFRGILYVASLNAPDRTPTAFRLPSANVEAMASDGDSIAIMLPGDDVGPPHVFVVCLVRGDTLTEHYFDYQPLVIDGYPRVLQRQNILLDSTRGIVDVFSVAIPHPSRRDSPRLCHMRFRLQDSREHAGSREPVCGSVIDPGCLIGRAIREIRYTGVGAQYHINLLDVTAGRSLAQEEPPGSLQDHFVVFDADSAMMHTKQARLPDQHPRGESELLKWKETYYSLREGQGSVFTYRETERKGQQSIVSKSKLCIEPESTLTSFTAHINERFLVRFEAPQSLTSGKRSICVYCFDEDMQLADGHSTGLWQTRSQPGWEPQSPVVPGEKVSRLIFTSPREQKLPFEDNASSTTTEGEASGSP